MAQPDMDRYGILRHIPGCNQHAQIRRMGYCKMMQIPPLPNAASDAYLWYMRGQDDEARARREGLSAGAIELIETMTALGQAMGISASRRNLILAVTRIYCPYILRRRFRREQ